MKAIRFLINWIAIFIFLLIAPVLVLLPRLVDVRALFIDRFIWDYNRHG